DGNDDPAQNTTSNPNNFYAWTWTHMDFSSASYNWNPDVDLKKRCLWPYTKAVEIYRCPADHSFVKNSLGGNSPRVRTMSMNLYVGGFAAAKTSPAGPGNDGNIGFGSKYVI